MFTYQDSVDHLVDYLGGVASDQVVRDCKRAVIASVRDLANAHRWSYHYTHGRVNTVAPYSTGTIAYDHTGGTYERMVTLSSGTWPTWAADGQIRFELSTDLADGPIYEVEERKSSSIITLSEDLNPGQDVSSGSVYVLYRDSYALPEDFIAQDEATYQDNFSQMDFIHPRDWLAYNRYRYSSGIPRYYTIVGDNLNNGRMTLRLAPYPDAAKTIDFVYQRRPRSLRILSETTGTVSMTSGASTVTGVGTAFTESMVGSVIRLSSTTTAPTSIVGDNPYEFESVITGFTSATSVTVRDSAPDDFASVAYVISDPIDIEQGAMLTAFQRGLEFQLSLTRVLKDKPSSRAAYELALALAKDADSRSFSGRSAGDPPRLRRRLRDMPISFEDQ